MTEATRTRNTKPLADFGKLTVADAEVPKGTRGSLLDSTPFVEWMKDSRARKVGKAFTVPNADAAKQATGLLRNAAQRVNCGVKIVADKPKPDGSVTIHFAAKDKRAVLTDAERAAKKAAADKAKAERAAKAKAAKGGKN